MTSTATVPQLKAATGATFLVFGINGLVFASWAARIPAVTEILQITAGQMGTLLLCVAVGSLIALPTAGFVVGRIGTANTVRSAGLVAAAAGVGVALSLMAASIPGTAIALFFFGIGVGLWDVSQNIEGADVEHRLGRTIMPQFHAAFSGGAFVGALIGAGLSTLGVGLPEHLLQSLDRLIVQGGHRTSTPSKVRASARKSASSSVSSRRTSRVRSRRMRRA